MRYHAYLIFTGSGVRVANYFSDVLNASEKHHHKIKKICQPVMEHFGIDYVTYHTVKADGTLTLAVNQPEIDQYYIENKIYEYDPYLRHPQFLSSGIMIWTEDIDPDFSQKLEQAGSDFQLDIGFSLIERTRDEVIMLGFAAKQKYPNQLSHYLNELPLFKQFFRHYLNESKKMITQMNDDPIELLPVLQDKFYDSPLANSELISSSLRHQFIRQVSNYWEADFLTASEKSCLRALLHRETAKQIGRKLELSYRTVEHLTERLRHKFDCFNKLDLYQKAKELEALGFFHEG